MSKTFTNKIIRITLFSIFFLLTFVLSKEYVNAYTCNVDAGYYCSAPIGGILRGPGVWIYSGQQCYRPDGDRVCFRTCREVTETRAYSCSGDDDDCNGGIRYWSSQSDCVAGLNRTSSFAGCCNNGEDEGGGGGGGGSCPACNAEELACPTPFTTTGDATYELENCRSCTACAGTDYASCFEIPNNIPTANLEIYANGVATNLNYYSYTFSGNVMNEPIRMVGTYTDTDGANDIEAVYVWLAKNGDAPQIGRIVTDGSINTTTEANSFGFMMRKEGSQWVPYLPNYRHVREEGDIEDAWVRYSGSPTSFYIDGVYGSDSVKVDITSITANGNTVTMDLNMLFNDPYAASDIIENGKYYLYVMAKDVFSFTPYDNYEGDALSCVRAEYGENEIRLNNPWINPAWGVYSRPFWDIDLTSPTIVNIQLVERAGTELTYSWEISDDHILYGLVGNVYITGSDNVTPITIKDLTGTGMPEVVRVSYPATNPFTPTTGTDEIIGYRPENNERIFRVYDIVASTSTGQVTIDTGDNNEGTLHFYLTVLDYGGNSNQGSDDGSGGGEGPGEDQTDPINLNDWFVTNGGLMYSSAGVNFDIRSISDVTLWDATNFLNRLVETRTDLSSELYGRLTNPEASNLIYSTINKSYSIGYNDSIDTAYYDDMRGSFDTRLGGLDITEISGNTSTLTGNLTDYGASSGMYYLDRATNLTVNSAFTCNAKGIFFVGGDLTIDGSIQNSNANRDACIFVVGGNVTINAGATSSTPSALGYDEINAYIFADGNVNVGEADIINDTDAIYINGGIQSTGGINVHRNLPLQYRDNFPLLVVQHHSKYGVFGNSILGSPVEMAKIEIGFKPF